MKPGKLQRVLYKEFTKSPVKTGFLLAMCPVALYFVVPLCLPKAKAKNRPAEPQVLAVADQPIPGETDEEAPYSWEELAAAMRHDTRMASATLTPLPRSPFHLEGGIVPDEAEPVVVQTEPVEEEPEEVREESQDILLTATLISRRARLATINGRTYQEQDFVRIGEETGGDTGHEASFRLAEVGQQYAVLVRQGKEVRLQLHSDQSSGITIQPSRSQGN